MLLGCAVVAAWWGPAAATGATTPRIIEEERIGDRVIVLTVATDSFTAPAKVDVFLPTGYDDDPSRRWPTTYVTAGIQNRYSSFRKVADGVRVTQDYPSLIVSPDGRSGWWSDWYNGGAGGAPRYEHFVVEELLPLIDRRFRTIADRRGRVISGISMGGYGAMMFAARHPDRFAAVSSMSGALNITDPLIMAVLSASPTFDGGSLDQVHGPYAEQEVRWRGHNPVDLAENLHAVDVQVRTANGTLDPAIGEDPLSADLASCVVEGGVHKGTQDFHRRLLRLGKRHVWKHYGNGCHSRANFHRQIVDTLDHLERVLANPPAPPERIDHRAIEPRFEVWGWEVRADPARALEFLRLRGDAAAMTFTGSGRTTVTSPPVHRGLRLVDVDGTPTPVDAEGRVRFTVDLGPAHRVQQYAPGAPSTFTTRKVTFAPHAVLQVTRARRVRRGVRVCVRAIGGEVPGATIRAGGRRARVDAGAGISCRTLRARRGTRVVVRGSDRFGHAARADARIRRR